MEDGLVQILWKVSKLSKMVLILIVVEDGLVLFLLFLLIFLYVVLILIVVDDGLVLAQIRLEERRCAGVLILIVVENGLVKTSRFGLEAEVANEMS